MTRVGIYFANQKIATGTIGPDGMIANVTPHDGKGVGHGQHLQITVEEGQNRGSTITALIDGAAGDRVTLREPMPFK